MLYSAFYVALVLMLIGALCLFIEALVPGFGVFGISGIILIIASAALTVIAVPMGIYIVIGEILVLGLLVYLVYSFLKRKQLLGSIILKDTLNKEEKEVGGLDYFLGKEGITKSTLRPVGTAEFGGVVLQVKSDSGYIYENTAIKVVAIVNDTLIVKSCDQVTN